MSGEKSISTTDTSKLTVMKIGPEDSVSVHTHYGDRGERTHREIVILCGHDKQEYGKAANQKDIREVLS